MKERQKSINQEGVPPTYETLQSQLEIVQNERDALKKELREGRENMREEILTELFNELNSEYNRHPLDELYKNVSKLNEIPRSDLIRVPPYVAMVSNEKSLLKAFERIGLKPFGNVGEKFELTPEKCENFELEGLPIAEGETKTVEIVSPGWEYKGKRIFLPKVMVVD